MPSAPSKRSYITSHGSWFVRSRDRGDAGVGRGLVVERVAEREQALERGRHEPVEAHDGIGRRLGFGDDRGAQLRVPQSGARVRRAGGAPPSAYAALYWNGFSRDWRPRSTPKQRLATCGRMFAPRPLASRTAVNHGRQRSGSRPSLHHEERDRHAGLDAEIDHPVELGVHGAGRVAALAADARGNELEHAVTRVVHAPAAESRARPVAA